MLKYILFLVLLMFYTYVNGSLDITFTKYEMCDGYKDTPIQYRANFTKINSTITLADAYANLTVPIGDDVVLDGVIEIYRHNQWKVLYNITNRSLCTVLNKYGGDLWYDIQKHFNVTPGTCPLPKGYYELKNYAVDFRKLPVRYAPKAKLRSTSHMMKNEELLLCFYGEFEIV